VSNLLNLFKRKRTIEVEVDEELRFHIDMQTDDYAFRGLSREKSKAMAEARFGDVKKIRTECIRISSGRTVLVWLLNSVFLLSLLIGLFLRVLAEELHVNRIGQLMMMIGGLGILLVYAKQAGAMVFKSNTQTFQLGLKKPSVPLSFDEKGRSPFDRVRTDD
jgi:hypothetical protein